MHNIKTNFDTILDICKSNLVEEINKAGNFRYYSRLPKMSDIEIISLSITMEILSIDSENLFWKKIESEYKNDFPNLIDRTRFNRRRKQLTMRINDCWSKLANIITKDEDTYVVDSMPIPVIKLVREKVRKTFKDDENNQPKKGYSATNKQFIIGYKLHLIVSKMGTPVDMIITPANVHDINFLKESELQLMNCDLIGDRAYLSQTLQLDLFTSNKIALHTANRSNQKTYRKFPKKYKGARMIIETVNAQLCDQFLIKRNYAKTYKGFKVRISSKIAAHIFSQFINYQNNKPIGKVKFATAA